MNRREFVTLTTLGVAGGVLGRVPGVPAQSAREEWDPAAPFRVTGKVLKVQPVFMYRLAERKEATSWKSWGGIQSEPAVAEEKSRISAELESLVRRADFPLQTLPVAPVTSMQDAVKLAAGDHDVTLLYACTGGGNLLQGVLSAKPNNLIFVRHASGPVYYWYEGLSVKFLSTDAKGSQPGGPARPGGVHVDDVVVDDYQELLWKLRALYGARNFIGTRIVALGGSAGKYAPEAPQFARDRFKLDLIEVSYDQFAPRLQGALADAQQVSQATRWAEKYLAMPHTRLLTRKGFVVNAFLLYALFKDLMREHNAAAFTIKDCMNTIMPMARTTACLSLSLLNDEGRMAFCESDFVIIPAGILLYYLSGKPVFLHNSTFPHRGMVTCAHCTAPRRLDANHYEPVQVMTHYESDYGAAPKVEMPIGQEVTFLDPEYSSGRWLGFKGIVKSNPFYEICRSQQDVEIQGPWKKLVAEARDSHWMMVYGDYLKEAGYAARKIGVQWVNISETA